MIELRHLRTLSILEQTGSLTSAAERLYLTQSALSHQIKELESRLGLALINRSARPLRLTTAGRRLLELAGRILPDVDTVLAELKGLAEGHTGRLAIASECHSCLDWLLPRLATYRNDFPGIELDVVLSASLDPLPRLLNGALDVVLSPDRRDMAGLAWTRLFEYKMKLVMAAGHRLAGRTYIEAEDLRAETLLAYPVDRARLDVFTRFLWPAGVEPARVRPVENTTLLLELAALEQGVAVLPDWACSAVLQTGRIKTARLGKDGLPGTLHACVREAETVLPHIAGFLASAQTFTPTPPRSRSRTRTARPARRPG
jgi:LysR family transcriptional regulator for metE and metH